MKRVRAQKQSLAQQQPLNGTSGNGTAAVAKDAIEDEDQPVDDDDTSVSSVMKADTVYYVN